MCVCFVWNFGNIPVCRQTSIWNYPWRRNYRDDFRFFSSTSFKRKLVRQSPGVSVFNLYIGSRCSMVHSNRRRRRLNNAGHFSRLILEGLFLFLAATMTYSEMLWACMGVCATRVCDKLLRCDFLFKISQTEFLFHYVEYDLSRFKYMNNIKQFNAFCLYFFSIWVTSSIWWCL